MAVPSGAYANRRRPGLWQAYRAFYIQRDAILSRVLGPAADGFEILCTLSALGWGLVIALTRASAVLPDTVLDRMDNIAPMWSWAMAFIGYGVFGLGSYIVSCRACRRFGAASGFFGWGLMGVYALFPLRPIFAACIVPLLTLASLASFLRLKRTLA